jgi:uncharacterized protein YdcH (DUF465 family)
MQSRPEKELKIISILYEEDQEFKRIWDEHNDLEKRLTELEKNRYLTPEEELEIRRIKKLKLLGKDRIEEMIRSRKVGIPG